MAPVDTFGESGYSLLRKQNRRTHSQIMATITPGTGGSLTSNTAEGQAVEALIYLQSRELNTAANPSGEDRITASIDIDVQTLTGSYRLPAVQSINSQGQLVIAAQSYLSGGGFTPGAGGTFKSTSIEAYVLEALMYLQFLEAQPQKNPQARNFVQGSYNADSATYSGTFSLPVSISLAAGGKIEIQANEYLQT